VRRLYRFKRASKNWKEKDKAPFVAGAGSHPAPTVPDVRARARGGQRRRTRRPNGRTPGKKKAHLEKKRRRLPSRRHWSHGRSTPSGGGAAPPARRFAPGAGPGRAHSESEELHPQSDPSENSQAPGTAAFGRRANEEEGSSAPFSRTPSRDGDAANGLAAWAAKGETAGGVTGVRGARRASVPAPGAARALSRQVARGGEEESAAIAASDGGGSGVEAASQAATRAAAGSAAWSCSATAADCERGRGFRA